MIYIFSLKKNVIVCFDVPFTIFIHCIVGSAGRNSKTEVVKERALLSFITITILVGLLCLITVHIVQLSLFSKN